MPATFGSKFAKSPPMKLIMDADKDGGAKLDCEREGESECECECESEFELERKL